MKKHRKIWHLVAQALYSWEINPEGRGQLHNFPWMIDDEINSSEQESAAFLLQLCLDNRLEIDRLIADHLINWHFSRLYPVDRALLRLGATLLICQRQIPAPLVLNETILLAKELGTDDSYRLLNGVLNKIAELARTDEKGNTS